MSLVAGMPDSGLHPPLKESDFLEQRKAQCETILCQLLAAHRVPFDTNISALLPRIHGLYGIARKGSLPHEFLHVGKSTSGRDGLLGRVWGQHYRIGGSSGDLIEKVKSKQGLSAPASRKWIKDNCVVQWVEVPNEQVRNWVEHYVLAVLRPMWGS